MPYPFVTTIDESAGLASLEEELSRASRFGVDTESNSLHVFREQVCYMQIGVNDRVFIIDTLAVEDLSSLAPFFEDSRIVKILHGADYDVSCLGRDFGIRIDPLFDTMIAAQILGEEKLGLAALVEHHFDVVLDKSLTRHDWGKRPLSEKYVKYLADDVIYLERLHDSLSAKLREADIEEEAQIEFRRVSRMPSGRKVPDPEAFRNIKGAGTLDQTGLSVLREAHRLRDNLAERINRPPFKVFGNQMLLAIASVRPRSLRALGGIAGFTQRVVGRHGKALLTAVARGIENRDNVPKRNPNRKPLMPKEQAALIDGLKDWRRQKIKSENRSGTLILPNHVLETLAAKKPGSLEELEAIEDLGRKRFERYGKEILHAIQNPPPPDRWRRAKR